MASLIFHCTGTHQRDAVCESWRIIDTARENLAHHDDTLIPYPYGATAEQVLASV